MEVPARASQGSSPRPPAIKSRGPVGCEREPRAKGAGADAWNRGTRDACCEPGDRGAGLVWPALLWFASGLVRTAPYRASERACVQRPTDGEGRCCRKDGMVCSVSIADTEQTQTHTQIHTQIHTQMDDASGGGGGERWGGGCTDKQTVRLTIGECAPTTGSGRGEDGVRTG
jgi:hypothetical protein